MDCESSSPSSRPLYAVRGGLIHAGWRKEWSRLEQSRAVSSTGSMGLVELELGEGGGAGWDWGERYGSVSIDL